MDSSKNGKFEPSIQCTACGDIAHLVRVDKRSFRYVCGVCGSIQTLNHESVHNVERARRYLQSMTRVG